MIEILVGIEEEVELEEVAAEIWVCRKLANSWQRVERPEQAKPETMIKAIQNADEMEV